MDSMCRGDKMDAILLFAMVIVICITLLVTSTYYAQNLDRIPQGLKRMGAYLFASQRREIIVWESLGILILLVFVVPAAFVFSVSVLPLVVIACIFLPIMIFLTISLGEERHY